jgi:hypothetical protein
MPQPYPHFITQFHCSGSVPNMTVTVRPSGFGRVNRDKRTFRSKSGG